MKKILFLLLVLISFTSFSRESENVENKENTIVLENGRYILEGENFEEEVEFLNGVPHGEYITTFKDNEVEKGRYVNGKKNGDYVVYYSDGGEEKGKYIDGLKQGKYIIKLPNGDFEIGEQKDDEVINYTFYGIDGTMIKGIFSDGEYDITFEYPNGDIEKIRTTNLILSGKSIYYHTDGKISEYEYENGERK